MARIQLSIRMFSFYYSVEIGGKGTNCLQNYQNWGSECCSIGTFLLSLINRYYQSLKKLLFYS